MKFFCFPFPWLGHGYASLAIKHLPHWPLCLAHLPHRTRTEWMVERVAFAICFAFACAFLFFAFISILLLLLLIPDTVLIPPFTQESQRERERENFSVLELLGNSCLLLCNWSQLATATRGICGTHRLQRRIAACWWRCHAPRDELNKN